MQPGFEPQKCYRCGEVKPVIDFAWRRKHKPQRDTFCRPCRSAYGREHYTKHKQRYIDQAQVRNQRLQLERTRHLLEYLASHPCVDCGETNAVVLEFDHLKDQSFSIGASLRYRSWRAVLQEIAKCEVVCANCHRIRTATRANSTRLRLLTESSS